MAVERRYRAIVEYDGTDFQGYQIQASGRTVQGEIEKTLEKVTRMAIRIDGAGRTDAGVHATGQVIAFNATWKHSLAKFYCALNALLPDDIVIGDLITVDPAFHPRFSALSRSYLYTIINQPWLSVLNRRYAYHVKKDLNLAAMNEASRFLIGCHDFASFGKAPQGDTAHTVREIFEASWSTNGNFLTFNITANAFLYRMVRTIVGTLVQVGLGELAVDEVKEILEARDLWRAAPPAPAHGLCLVKVTYPLSG